MKRYFILEVVVALVIFVFVTSVIAFYCEQDTTAFTGLGDAVWWCIVTMTTVGYGDTVPITWQGKVVATIVMFVGVVSFSAMIGVTASALVEYRRATRKGLRRVRMKNHIVICGYNAQVPGLVQELKKQKIKNITLVADSLSEKPEDLDVVFVHGSPAQRETLKKARIEFARNVLILGQSDERVLLSTYTARRLTKAHICVETIDPTHNDELVAAGCDELVNTGQLSNILMAQSVEDPGVASLVTQVSGRIDREEIDKVCKYGDLVKELFEQGKTPVAIQSNGQMLINPVLSTEISPGDMLFYIGEEKLNGQVT